jgi:hypothetical protein
MVDLALAHDQPLEGSDDTSVLGASLPTGEQSLLRGVEGGVVRTRNGLGAESGRREKTCGLEPPFRQAGRDIGGGSARQAYRRLARLVEPRTSAMSARASRRSTVSTSLPNHWHGASTTANASCAAP